MHNSFGEPITCASVRNFHDCSYMWLASSYVMCATAGKISTLLFLFVVIVIVAVVIMKDA